MSKILPLTKPTEACEPPPVGGASWLLLSRKKGESKAKYETRVKRCKSAYESGYEIDWSTGTGPPRGRVNWFRMFGGYFRLKTPVSVLHYCDLTKRTDILKSAFIFGKIFARKDSSAARLVSRVVLHLPAGLPNQLWKPPVDLPPLGANAQNDRIVRALVMTLCPRVREYKSDFKPGVPLDTFAWGIPTKIWMDRGRLCSEPALVKKESVQERCKCGTSQYLIYGGTAGDAFQCTRCDERTLSVNTSVKDDYPYPLFDIQKYQSHVLMGGLCDECDYYFCKYEDTYFIRNNDKEATASSYYEIVRGEPEERKVALIRALGATTGALVNALYDADLVYAEDGFSCYYTLGDVVFSPTFSGFLHAMERNPGRYEEFIILC